MTDFGKKIVPFPLKMIDALLFNGTFLPVEGPTTELVRIIRFINDTDQDAIVSWDGINGHDFIPGGTALTLDVTSNKVSDGGYFVSVGTQFFVEATVGTGFFVIATYGSETS